MGCGTNVQGVGQEDRTLYWVTTKLNGMEFPASAGGKWYPSRVSYILRQHCYTGSHAYNVHARVSNPARPLGDTTAKEKRTLLETRPSEQWVIYNIPALISEDLWQRANKIIKEPGRGKGKQGKSIDALLRNRLLCPQCDKPMVVRRNGHQNRVYYHFFRYSKPWADAP